jgi:hypothetical protein
MKKERERPGENARRIKRYPIFRSKYKNSEHSKKKKLRGKRKGGAKQKIL